jgi:hypothetical protein
MAKADRVSALAEYGGHLAVNTYVFQTPEGRQS